MTASTFTCLQSKGKQQSFCHCSYNIIVTAMSAHYRQRQPYNLVLPNENPNSIPTICISPPGYHETQGSRNNCGSEATVQQKRAFCSRCKDPSVFILPEVAEESSEIDNNNSCGKEFRGRVGSGSLKSLFKRIKSKSGDGQSSSATTNTTAPAANGDIASEKNTKGLKAFFRPRSQSDAVAVRNAMLRRRHISTGGAGSLGSQIVATPADVLNNNHAPVQRSRSTSWGAKEKLAMSKQMRISGSPGTSAVTPMSQLLSGGGLPINRKVERSPAGSFDNQFTGKAFIWQRAASIDDPSRRQVAQTTNSKTRRAQFVNNKWNTADVMETEFEDLVKGDTEIFNKFLKAHKCYDLIPASAKLVVFDTQLSVKKAFYALSYNCVKAAPLWDSSKQNFVGMLTISDFIFLLTTYYKTPEAKLADLEDHKISTWHTLMSGRYEGLVSISPDASLHRAVRTLLRTRIHRLPIVDPLTGNALYILTHRRVLKFLYLYMRRLPQPMYMEQSLDELKIGTYSNLAKVTMGTKLIDALNMFVNRRVSVLPVLNEGNQVLDIYAKFDVINLALDKLYTNLEISMAHAIQVRKSPTEPLQTCSKHDSLKVILEKLVRTEAHRLVIVDGDNRLEGIVSLSDILNYLVCEDRHYSGSFSNGSCSEDVFEECNHHSMGVGSDSEDMSISMSDLVIRPCNHQTSSVCDDKMDVFPPEPLEAI